MGALSNDVPMSCGLVRFADLFVLQVLFNFELQLQACCCCGVNGDGFSFLVFDLGSFLVAVAFFFMLESPLDFFCIHHLLGDVIDDGLFGLLALGGCTWSCDKNMIA